LIDIQCCESEAALSPGGALLFILVCSAMTPVDVIGIESVWKETSGFAQLLTSR